LRIQKERFLDRVRVREAPSRISAAPFRRLKLLLVGEVEGFALGEYLVGEVWGDFL
jgi:hypothetical protein